MLKKVNRPILYAKADSVPESENERVAIENMEKTEELKDKDPSPFRNRNIFPKMELNLWELMPNDVRTPSISEGTAELTIVNCQHSTVTYGKHSGTKRVTYTFRNEEGQEFTQTFFLGQKNPNFVKFIANVFGGEIPDGEFRLDTLKGMKIEAHLYHNYTPDGCGYVNIACCRPIESNYVS